MYITKWASARRSARGAIGLLFVVASPTLGFTFDSESDVNSAFECPVEGAIHVDKLDENDLAGVLFRHERWLRNPNSGDTKDAANLSNKDLKQADLRRRDLRQVVFENADLSSADLSDADLRGARFDGAILRNANLKGAQLRGAFFRNTCLNNTDLTKADLRGAILTGADMTDANILDARLRRSKLKYVLYQPISVPQSHYIAEISGLDTLRFSPGSQDALVRLRELLRKAGLRDLERKATYSLESTMARQLLSYPDALSKIEGATRIVLFEWTTKWGMKPARALIIVLFLMAVAFVIYYFFVANWSPFLQCGLGRRFSECGVFQVWPSDRLDPASTKMIARDATVVRISKGPIRSVGWAIYFSVLSTFQIGLRDVELGRWIWRLQRREYVLRGHGLIRIVSGLQSLACLYLISVSALTYFGRPFQ